MSRLNWISRLNSRPRLVAWLPLLAAGLALLFALRGCASPGDQPAAQSALPALDGSLQPLEAPSPGAQPVTVGLYASNVYNIDFSSNTYYLSGFLWLRWTGDIDPTDTVELINTVDEWGTIFEPTMLEPEVLPDGARYQVFRVQGRFHQPFDPRHYPLDRQSLSVLVEDTNHDVDEIVFVPDIADSGVDSRFSIPGWNIIGASIIPYVHDYGTNFGESGVNDASLYSAVEFAIHMERGRSVFALKLMLPLVIVLFTAWLTLVLHPKMMDLRTAMPATALLTTVFLHQAAGSAIPQAAGLVLTDKIYALAYVVILLTFATIIADNLRYDAEDAQRIRRMRRLDLVSLGVQVIVFSLGIAALVYGAG
ncbi:MAG: hypothetical protein ACKOC5_15590 [Chloroflexota bacterium]